MQNVVFVGHLATDPQIAEDFGKAVFRLLERRMGGDGKPQTIGVNCVSWGSSLNRKILPRVPRGSEVMVTGAFSDTKYIAHDGSPREAKELVVSRLTVLDWV
ncbi:single-stranded DNA-binding protein [Brevundimonas sp.]|uniref:single-stranded DNA-binding protein n=1 Tax=Brevundimonas sp. TaxID=1871086 RepID=UPI002579ADB4|nr:single-stranded DNA-binding protein [Brevundimonas sp.]